MSFLIPYHIAVGFEIHVIITRKLGIKLSVLFIVRGWVGTLEASNSSSIRVLQSGNVNGGTSKIHIVCNFALTM